MTKVKICGITNLDDALLAAKFGADALGFNFYERSARYISPENARAIIENLPANVLTVGVFVNESSEKILATVETANLAAVQLHGEETPEFVRALREKFAGEIIKAFRVSANFKPEDILKYEVHAILLDAYSPKEHGGTGETFDWAIAKRVREIFPKMYLAGGLSAENVLEALEKVKPYAIDACSSLELEKGKKDKLKTIMFVEYSKKKNYLIIQNIYDVLFHIQLMPEIYIGGKSLTSLATYLSGFQMALIIGEGRFDNKHFFQDEFYNFISGKLNYDVSEKHWLKKVLEKSNNNEERAFDLFFALLEEFKLEKEDLSDE